MKVVLPVEDVQSSFDAVTQEYCKQAKIPGFRKGKVPTAVIKKRFEEEIKSEVMNRLFRETYRNALQEQDIKPLFYPIMENISLKEGAPLEFSLLVDVKPKIKLKKYKNLKVKGNRYTVDDAKVQETLDYLQSQKATYESKGEGVAADWFDSCVMDFVVTVGGDTIREETGFRIVLEEEHLLKDILSLAKGLRVGEITTKTVILSDCFPEKDYVGQEAQIMVDLKGIYQKFIPPLDDEFAKDMGEFLTLTDFKARVKQDLEENFKRRTRQELEETLIKELIVQNPFDPPLSLIEEQEKMLMSNMEKRLIQQGVAKGFAEEHVKTLHEDMYKRAEEMVRMQLLFDCIAEKETLEVSPEAVDKEIEDRAAHMKQSKDILKKQLIDEERLDYLIQSLKDDKVLALLVDQANVNYIAAKDEGVRG
jgi:trigger factor